MPKLTDFNTALGTLVHTTEDGFEIYESKPNIARMYLVKDGKRLSFANWSDTIGPNSSQLLDFDKWAYDWKRAQSEKLAKLTTKINNLVDERLELFEIIK